MLGLINAGRVLQLIPLGCIWGMPIWPATLKRGVIMTKRAESATSSKKHRKEGGLTQEELEALSSVLAKMFRDASGRGRQDPFLGEEEIFAEE